MASQCFFTLVSPDVPRLLQGPLGFSRPGGTSVVSAENVCMCVQSFHAVHLGILPLGSVPTEAHAQGRSSYLLAQVPLGELGTLHTHHYRLTHYTLLACQSVCLGPSLSRLQIVLSARGKCFLSCRAWHMPRECFC